jgi:hypothetical protein
MLSRLLIRICAWFVPASLRSRWREEWLGEVEATRPHSF